MLWAVFASTSWSSISSDDWVTDVVSGKKCFFVCLSTWIEGKKLYMWKTLSPILRTPCFLSEISRSRNKDSAWIGDKHLERCFLHDVDEALDADSVSVYQEILRRPIPRLALFFSRALFKQILWSSTICFRFGGGDGGDVVDGLVKAVIWSGREQQYCVFRIPRHVAR